MFARYGGARALFPADWVVDDVDGAARRVLSSCADEATWRAAGEAAAAQVIAAYDWDRVGSSFDRLLAAAASARSA
jgi:glycosyltransferase involved in cell wall biosynthesis